ncbi:MAG: exodeoxyribonuclease VII large subunit [Bdellovibrionales bacterium]|nr:exodeoxyribonuclease VII large subunit [Bdellovibrionales bacterium]
MDLFEYAQKLKEESEKPKSEATAKTNNNIDEAIFSVSELTREIKDLIVSRFGGEKFWVKGEISNFRGRNQSGHMYFRLKDESAVLNCVFFKGANAKLKFDLKEGMEVLVHGRMDLWEKGGNYQLVVDHIREGGTGELYLKFEILKKKLEAEGLFLSEHKKALPSFPKVLGIVTSATGAVVRDIIHVVRTRCPHVKLLLYPVRVQGDSAAGEIRTAIEDFNKMPDPPELIIVGRGGGSIEDLWPFNEELVARAIFESKIPIISAVGHQTDFTIADFTADVRAATPSQAAEMAVPNIADLESKLLSLMKAIVRELIHYREMAHQRLYRLTQAAVLRDPKHFIRVRAQLLDTLIEQLKNNVVLRRRVTRERLSRQKMILTITLQKWLPPRKLRFEKLASNLSLLNPLAILQRGYSVVQTDQGQILKKSSEVLEGQSVKVRLFKGELLCKVTKILKKS